MGSLRKKISPEQTIQRNIMQNAKFLVAVERQDIKTRQGSLKTIQQRTVNSLPCGRVYIVHIQALTAS